jgi:predicted fused transcriptional regulator/phosphomethylpyrimidine kinase
LRASIQAWRDYNSVENMQPPFDIDARKPVWSIEELGIRIAATVNINMIHIAPWSACLGLMAGAGRILASRGILYIYGPFKQGGEHTAQSNLAFDRSLREQNSEWGVRNLEDVLTAAFEQGFSLLETVPMPANNFSVIFQRQ